MTRPHILAILALAFFASGGVTGRDASALAIGGAPVGPTGGVAIGPASSRAIADYGRLPLVFERAVDPADGTTRYVGHGSGYAVAVSARGILIAARGTRGSHPDALLALDFIGADPRAAIEGVDLRPTRIHRLRAGGDDTDIPTYARVRVSGAYPKIDVVYYGQGRSLEYDLVVAPGGDPTLFAFRVDGNATAELEDAGDLVVTGPAGTLRLQRPIAYQEIDGNRISVDSAFVLANGREVRIRVGDYDRAHTLVIDPVVSYATYLGGNSFEQATAIAVDASGSAYVTGYTMSSDFPTVSAYDRSLGKSADVDVFVSKLNAAGTALVWSTYLGGAGSVERAIGIAVDAAGSAYVTGRTAGNNFPVSATAWQRAVAGGGAFITKLGPNGNTLVYSTYVAGATANAIAVDQGGNAYVVGNATPAFTTTPGTLQPAPGNTTSTGFVVKLNAAGSAPVYSTFIGGGIADDATSVAVDARGNAFVAGWTSSSDFPTQNAFQAELRGQKDAFVAKLDPAGSRLVYATLLGGVLDDAVNAIAIDGTGHAYVAGETYSTNFPSRNGFQPIKAGGNLVNSSVGNAFVTKLAPAGNAIVYSSFLGGEICTTPCQLAFGGQPQFRGDAAYGIAVDSTGHAHVTGIARSYTFPLVDSNATRKREDTDDSAFVTKVGATGGRLLWSTFVRTGFNEADNRWTRFPPGAATGVAIDASGAAYVTGDADAYSDFQPTPGAFQTTQSDLGGAVIVKFAASPLLALASSNTRVEAQTPITLTATLAGAAVTGNVAFLDGSTPFASAPLVANKATLQTTLPIGIHALSALLLVPGMAADTPVIHQIVEPPLGCN